MYVIDTSALLDGWARHYPPDVFPSLWSLIEAMIKVDELLSPDEVLAELSQKDDAVYQWAKTNSAMFVPLDEDIQIPRGIETIQVPNREVYRVLNLEDLISEYHNLVAGESAVRTAELRLLDALIVSLENEAQWSRINKRRFHLITKKHSIGLDTVENDELEELQRLADMHADSAQPLPFPELAMLRDYARKLGFVERP